MMISVNIYIEVNVENTIYSTMEKDKWRAKQVKNKPLSLRVCDYSEKKIVTKKSKINIKTALLFIVLLFPLHCYYKLF